MLMQVLGMKHVMVQFVPQFLLPGQKERCAAVANDLIQTATNEPDFFKMFITRDESWSLAMIWKWRPSCPSACHLVLLSRRRSGSHSKMKTMLTVFFIGKVLSIMSTPLLDKQLIRSTTSVFLVCWQRQYDKNSCSYEHLVMGSFITTTHPLIHHFSCSFLAKHQITQVTQPPCSPDMEPWDFWLFPKLKSPLKRKRFHTIMRFRKIWQGSWWQFQQRILQCFEQWKRL